MLFDVNKKCAAIMIKKQYLGIKFLIMKNKFIYSIILFLLQSTTLHLFAQCNPDLNLKTSGIFPVELEQATETKPYAQIIQFRMPKDTMVTEFGFPILATIDSIVVTKVNGLPANFTYQCNQVNCKANGGETGCILLSGLPQVGQQGIYPLSVVIKVYARALTITRTIEDSVTRYSLTVNAATNLSENEIASKCLIYPVPSQGIINIDYKNNNEPVNVHLFDLNMRELPINPDIDKGANQVQINLSHLQSGCYYIIMQIGKQTIREKIILVD